MRVTGGLDVGRVGGLERQHTILCHVYGVLETAKDTGSDCPTPVETSSGRPPRLQQSSHGTGKRLRSRRRRSSTWSWPLLELGARFDVPTVPQSHSSQTTRTEEQRRKRPKQPGENSDRVVIFMTLARLVLATVHGSSCDIKVGGPCLWH